MRKAKILETLGRRPDLRKEYRGLTREIVRLSRRAEKAARLVELTDGVVLHDGYPVKVGGEDGYFDVHSPVDGNDRYASGNLIHSRWEVDTWRYDPEGDGAHDIVRGDYPTRKAAFAAAVSYVATGKRGITPPSTP